MRDWRKMLRWCLFVLALAGIILLLRALHFAYVFHPFSGPFECASIPPNSTVLALGFVYQQKPGGTLDSGEANRFLAAELLRCQERIGMIYTQKAISYVFEANASLQAGKLLGVVPVRQMHAHQPGKSVRTLQALQLALNQMNPPPDNLVLLAHDKQMERAHRDLAALYAGRVIVWQVRDVPYQDNIWFRPLFWALRELYIARPLEAVQRWKMTLSH